MIHYRETAHWATTELLCDIYRLETEKSTGLWKIAGLISQVNNVFELLFDLFEQFTINRFVKRVHLSQILTWFRKPFKMRYWRWFQKTGYLALVFRKFLMIFRRKGDKFWWSHIMDQRIRRWFFQKYQILEFLNLFDIIFHK